MTLVVGMARTYWAERRYVLGVVLGEWLGLEWRPEEHPHADVRIRLDGEDDRVVTLPDVLFATDRARWLTTAAPAPTSSRRTAAARLQFGMTMLRRSPKN